MRTPWTWPRASCAARSPLAAREPAIPYGSEGPRFTPPPYDGNSWWTAGFWPALMWQMYALGGDNAFLQEARRAQALLGEQLRRFTLLHHDVGFMYLLSDGADFKLTGDESARVDTLHAATLLMGRFKPRGLRARLERPRPGRRGHHRLHDEHPAALLGHAPDRRPALRPRRLHPRGHDAARVHSPPTAPPATSSSWTRTPARACASPADRATAPGSSWSRGAGLGAIRLHAGRHQRRQRRLSPGRRAHRPLLHPEHPPRRLTDCDFPPAANARAHRQHRRRGGRLRPDRAGAPHRRGGLRRRRPPPAGRPDRALLRPPTPTTPAY